ncbi:MAG TPA: HAD-IA family hydrolase [Myxococcota bacterium]|nr:HAD-IA family hydrolase [Myxococcota bacterium]
MAEAQRSRVVVFDFDGTLADTWRDLATALNRTLSDAGLSPVEGPQVQAWIGDGALKLLANALPPGERAPERLEPHYERFRAHYDRCCLDTTDLYPGIPGCLEALSGESLAVLSNKPARFLDRILDGLGMKGVFGAVLGGDALPIRKPDPAVLAAVLERLRAEPDEVWMIGDSAVDVETGRAAGARTIGCGWGLRGREELRAAGVEFLVEHPREIAPLVLGRRAGA